MSLPLRDEHLAGIIRQWPRRKKPPTGSTSLQTPPRHSFDNCSGARPAGGRCGDGRPLPRPRRSPRRRHPRHRPPARLSRPRPARIDQRQAEPEATACHAGRSVPRRPGRLRVRGRHVRHRGGDGDGARVWHQRGVGAALNPFRHGRPYALPAIEAGFIAMVFSNASPAMPPWGGKDGAPRHQSILRRRTRRKTSTVSARHVAGGGGARNNSPRGAPWRANPPRLCPRRAGPRRPTTRPQRSAAWCCRSASTRVPASRR